MCSREHPARRHEGAPTLVSPTKCHASLPWPTVPDSSLTIDNSTCVPIIPYSTITTCESNAASMSSWNGYNNASAILWREKEVFYAIIFPLHENILAIFSRNCPELNIFMETVTVRETSPVVERQEIWEVAVFIKDRRYACNKNKLNCFPGKW